MADENSTYELIIRELGQAIEGVLDDLGNPATSPKTTLYFLRRLGWNVPVDSDLSGTSFSFINSLSALNLSTPNANLLDGLQNVISEFDNVDGELSAAGALVGFATEFPRQLLDYTIMRQLEYEHPKVFAFLLFIGVFDTTYQEPATPSRIGYKQYRIEWERLITFFQKPYKIAEIVYGWGTANFNDKLFLERIQLLLSAFDIPWADYRPNDGAHTVNIPFVDQEEIKAGIEVFCVATDSTADNAGFALSPFLLGNVGTEIEINDYFTLILKASIVLDKTAGIEVRPKTAIKLFGLTGASTIEGNFEVTFRISGEENLVRLGAKESTRLEIGAIELTAKADVSPSEQEFRVEISLADSRIVLASDGGDSFISSLLPLDPVEVSLDMGIGYSTKTGIYFKGSDAIEIQLPVHISIGPISIEGITITIRLKEQKIPISIGASINGKLGPLAVVIENMGVTVDLSFPANNRGNVGPVDLGFGFKFPDAIGLSLDTPAVKAGGFLSIKPDEYIGALELEIKSIQLAIKAIAIINTKLPGGEPGFSLLVIITAEFSPISLMYGFTLNGLGGLFGFKRSFQADELRLGLKTKALDSILFPKDVIANITKIVGDLKKVFPMGNNFLIGPMIKIGWGVSLITIEIGILIQVPNPIVIAILGIIRLQLPEPKDPVLKLQINFLGIIDFGKKMLSLDASLSDSRILVLSLTGDFALRIGWGSPSVFIFSSGGFHPDFKEAPVELQHMERLGIIIINEEELKLGAGTYFALTTNTVQIGAFARLWAKLGSYTVVAQVGFDALIQFNPFFFTVAIYLTGRVTGPMIDIGIEVRANLSGPNVWHVWGHAQAKVMFFAISIPFDKTFGEPIEELSAGSENVFELLKAEIPKNTNWKTTTVFNTSPNVSLREITPGPDAMIVHPNTVLSFNQRVVPLEVVIQNFGNKEVDGARDYAVSAKVSQSTVTDNALYDLFAPGNFFKIDKDKKLSRPSFEQMKSGKEFTIRPNMAVPATPVPKDIDHEVIYIRKKKPVSEGGITLLEADKVVLLASGGAAGKSKFSHENTRVSHQAPPKIKINKPGYVVANKADLGVVKDAAGVATTTYGNQTEAYNKQLEFEENDTLILSTQEI